MKYVLVLLMTVFIVNGCVGSKQVWENRVQNNNQSSIDQKTLDQLKQMSNANKIAQIVKNTPNTVTIQNVGTETIEASEINVYVNQTSVSCIWNATSIGPGKTMTCNLSSPCFSGTLHVVAPGARDTTTC